MKNLETWAASRPFTRLVQAILREKEEAQIYNVPPWYACMVAFTAILFFVSAAETALTLIPLIWDDAPEMLLFSFLLLVLSVVLFGAGLETVADLENMKIERNENEQ